MVDFYVTKGGRNRYLGETYQPDIHGFFTTFFVQNALIDYFTVGENYIDAYDGAVFEDEQLDQLTKQLEAAIVDINSKPPKWPLENETSQIYEEELKQFNGRTPRDECAFVIEKALHMAKKARQTNEKLVFCGD